MAQSEGGNSWITSFVKRLLVSSSLLSCRDWGGVGTALTLCFMLRRMERQQNRRSSEPWSTPGAELRRLVALVRAELLQSCTTPCDPMDCSPPGSSVLGFSRQEYWSGLPCLLSGGSSRPRDQTHVSYVSCIDWRVLHY